VPRHLEDDVGRAGRSRRVADAADPDQVGKGERAAPGAAPNRLIHGVLILWA
jgi:hypothetical protein